MFIQFFFWLGPYSRSSFECGAYSVKQIVLPRKFIFYYFTIFSVSQVSCQFPCFVDLFYFYIWNVSVYYISNIYMITNSLFAFNFVRLHLISIISPPIGFTSVSFYVIPMVHHCISSIITYLVSFKSHIDKVQLLWSLTMILLFSHFLHHHY